MVDRAALRARIVQLLGYAPSDEELGEVATLVETVAELPPIGGVDAPEPAVAFVPVARSDRDA